MELIESKIVLILVVAFLALGAGVSTQQPGPDFYNQGLPPGWTAQMYEGRPYYLHEESRTTQWERPIGTSSIDINVQKENLVAAGNLNERASSKEQTQNPSSQFQTDEQFKNTFQSNSEGINDPAYSDESYQTSIPTQTQTQFVSENEKLPSPITGEVVAESHTSGKTENSNDPHEIPISAQPSSPITSHDVYTSENDNISQMKSPQLETNSQFGQPNSAEGSAKEKEHEMANQPPIPTPFPQQSQDPSFAQSNPDQMQTSAHGNQPETQNIPMENDTLDLAKQAIKSEPGLQWQPQQPQSALGVHQHINQSPNPTEQTPPQSQTNQQHNAFHQQPPPTSIHPPQPGIQNVQSQDEEKMQGDQEMRSESNLPWQQYQGQPQQNFVEPNQYPHPSIPNEQTASHLSTQQPEFTEKQIQFQATNYPTQNFQSTPPVQNPYYEQQYPYQYQQPQPQQEKKEASHMAPPPSYYGPGSSFAPEIEEEQPNEPMQENKWEVPVGHHAQHLIDRLDNEEENRQLQQSGHMPAPTHGNYYDTSQYQQSPPQYQQGFPQEDQSSKKGMMAAFGEFVSSKPVPADNSQSPQQQPQPSAWTPHPQHEQAQPSGWGPPQQAQTQQPYSPYTQSQHPHQAYSAQQSQGYPPQQQSPGYYQQAPHQSYAPQSRAMAVYNPNQADPESAGVALVKNAWQGILSKTARGKKKVAEASAAAGSSIATFSYATGGRIKRLASTATEKFASILEEDERTALAEQNRPPGFPGTPSQQPPSGQYRGYSPPQSYGSPQQSGAQREPPGYGQRAPSGYEQREPPGYGQQYYSQPPTQQQHLNQQQYPQQQQPQQQQQQQDYQYYGSY